jgi:hypothetical protein
MNHNDPGLQPQRTSLAWSRTGFSVFINALVVLRTAGNTHHALLFALGLGLLLAAGIVAVCGINRSTALNSGLKPAGPSWLLMISVITASLTAAVAGILCIMLV